MSSLASLALRASVPLIIGLLLDVLLRSRAAALRHCILAASIAAAGAIAPLSLVLPVLPVTIPARVALVDPLPASTVAPESGAPLPSVPLASRRGLTLVLVTVWGFGVAVAGGTLLIALVRLRRITANSPVVTDEGWNGMAADAARTLGIRRPVTLVQTSSPELLATWGCSRPHVLLPSHAADWSADRRRVVLCHEMAHILRHDWLVQIAAESLRAFAWFHPLIWIACTRLRRAAEQACDDVVLRQGVPAPVYAAHLIDLARHCRPAHPDHAGAMPMANPSTLERRIVAMLNPRLTHRALSGRAALSVLLLLIVSAVPAAILRAQEGPRVLGGSIYDPSGAVMPGVTVTLEDAAHARTAATTNASGQFQFGAIAPGTYVLSAALPGFRALRQEFELRTARDWDRAITLQVGTLSETIHVQDTRITAPETTSQPQSTTRVRVGGNLRAPRKQLDVKPIYPSSMRAAGREGVVPIEAVIGVDGLVTAARVLTADVHPDFAIAAVDAVRQWRFTPTLLNGKAVEVVMTVTVTFSLAQ